MSLAISPLTSTSPSQAEAFALDGLCFLDGVLPSSWVAGAADAALARLGDCLDRHRIRTRDGLPLGTHAGYSEIVQRAPGRYDVLHGADRAPFDDALLGDDAPWIPLVRQLLGPECRPLYQGLLVAMPGGREQPWHTDGEHLFPGSGLHLPVHCLNVFVPLVDLSVDNGPTEFCPGSHRLTGGISTVFEQDRHLPEKIGYRGTPVVPTLPAGSVLLFDYRLVHRGLANRTAAPRPLLYITFAAPWFRDVRNFPERRLFD